MVRGGSEEEDRPEVSWGRVDRRAEPGQGLSFLESPGTWPAPDLHPYNEASRPVTPARPDEVADSPEKKREEKKLKMRKENGIPGSDMLIRLVDD